MDPMDRRGGGPSPGMMSSGLGSSSAHHRSRSATRSVPASGNRSYHSLDRDGHEREREFIPIRENRDGRDPRDRSLERGMDPMGRRDRSVDRAAMLEDDLLYRDGPGVVGGSSGLALPRSARQSPAVDLAMKASSGSSVANRDGYLMELQAQNTEFSRELANLKRELELTNQKLGSSMHSIKTFWSPELKKERALRKEESAKYSLINDQLKLLNAENQKQAMLVRQLEEELRIRSMQNPSLEVRQQMESLFAENEHLTREVAILRETVKEMELRIDTQKQTLQSRDESIKKLLEMLQNKGLGKDEERVMLQQMQTMAQKQMEEMRAEVGKRDQELLAMGAKMKTLEEQHQDYQRHIAVLKESLCAKEEHYNMLQTDVEELRQRLEEKNRLIEKKTQAALQATQERNRLSAELNELRDHTDIKDRKISVLQRKLELQEANERLNNGNSAAAKEAEQLTQMRKQVEEQKRQLDELRKNSALRAKDLEEKENRLKEADARIRKMKEALDHAEAKLKSVKESSSSAPNEADSKELLELQQRFSAREKEVEKLQRESKQAQSEMERLLQLMQMSQEEQFAKDKTIVELQEALRMERSKRQQQNAASGDESRRSSDNPQNHPNKGQNCSRCDQLTAEIEEKKQRIAELENCLGSVEQTERDLRARVDKIEEMETEIRHRTAMHRLEVTDLENRSQQLQNERDELRKELEQLRKREEEAQHLVEVKDRRIAQLEVDLSNCDTSAELGADLDDKNERIEELEEALRESVRITAEREVALDDAVRQRILHEEKIARLEQRLQSLYNAQSLKCPSCRPNRQKLHEIESRLSKLLAERRSHLHELYDMKQEALEAAISERDAQLALLEVSGIKTAKAAEQADHLKADRKRLMELMREQNERRVKLLQEYEDPFTDASFLSEKESCIEEESDEVNQN